MLPTAFKIPNHFSHYKCKITFIYRDIDRQTDRQTDRQRAKTKEIENNWFNLYIGYRGEN